MLAVTTLLDLAAGGSAAPKAIAWTLASSLILAVASGILAGMLWSYLLPVLSEERFWQVLTFAAVLLVYSGVHFMLGNDLISVLVFGLTLSGNIRTAHSPNAFIWMSPTGADCGLAKCRLPVSRAGCNPRSIQHRPDAHLPRGTGFPVAHLLLR